MCLSLGKKIVRMIRDVFFAKLEWLSIFILGKMPTYQSEDNLVVIFVPRPGRGLQESENDNLWLSTLPKKANWIFQIYRYNSKVWLIQSLQVIKLVTQRKIQKVVLVQYVPKFHKFPSMNLLNYIQNSGVEVIKCWMDSYNDALWNNRILAMSKIGKINIITDRNDLDPNEFDGSNKYVFHPTPLPSYELIPFFERKNLVYYSGGVSNLGSYQPRKEHLSYLTRNKIEVIGVSYDRDSPGMRPTYDQYRKDLADSRIGLNFTWKGDKHVIVSRTWEILLSQVVLLQNESNVLHGLFESGTHFLEFTCKEELLEIINLLSSDYKLAKKISLAGHERAKELYDFNEFWPKVLQNKFDFH